MKADSLLTPISGHTRRCYLGSMLWKTALAICFWMSLAGEGYAQTRRSESSFNSFLTDGKGTRDRITLVGEPRSPQLDALLPANATKMFRVVLICSVTKAGKLSGCRKDPSFPHQFGDLAVARKALKGVSVSNQDVMEIRRKGLQLEVVVYLDDPTRPLDRFNLWSVPTPEPAPPPLR